MIVFIIIIDVVTSLSFRVIIFLVLNVPTFVLRSDVMLFLQRFDHAVFPIWFAVSDRVVELARDRVWRKITKFIGLASVRMMRPIDLDICTLSLEHFQDRFE
jgi:hypothetical protein